MISVSIIAKNEENSIVRCLESLKGFDEIIVCDTGSTDKTVEIAKRYTDKVFTDFVWNDSFADARNHALDKCTGDWIFTIDCDCVLVTPIEQMRKEVELAEKEGNETIQVQCCEEKGTTSHWLPLIYKHTPKIRWVGNAHNHLSAENGRCGEIRIDYWYSDSHEKDPDRTFRILKKTVSENPACVREKFYLAREYWYRRDYITAIHWYKQYLNNATFGAEMADAYLTMARCYWYIQEGDLARACCLQAIGLNTNFKEALLFMAEMSGPGNSKRWKFFAESASNESILFVRVP